MGGEDRGEHHAKGTTVQLDKLVQVDGPVWTSLSNWTVGEAGSRCVDVDLYQSNGSISKYGMKA